MNKKTEFNTAHTGNITAHVVDETIKPDVEPRIFIIEDVPGANNYSTLNMRKF